MVSVLDLLKRWKGLRWGVSTTGLPGTGSSTGERSAERYFIWVANALMVGAAIRVLLVQTSNFPLNDGGLFYAMVRDLQEAHYILPWVTSYNSSGIPFAYPPLPFYLAGLLDDLTPLTLLDVLRYLPLIASIATILAFYRLSNLLLSSGIAAVFAVFAFALTPRSFSWEIMGGGLTRSLGFLFAVLAVHEIYLLYRSPSRSRLLAAVAFSCCTVLSHMEMALFVAYTTVLFFVVHGRNWRGLADSTLLLLSTASVTSPWWVIVLGCHGFSPFLSATDHATPEGYGFLAMATMQLTEETLFPIVGSLALLGALVCLSERRLLLVGWLALIIIVDPRKSATLATIPMAMMAGIGLRDLLILLLARSTAGDSGAADVAVGTDRWLETYLPTSALAKCLLVLLLMYGIVSAFASPLTLYEGLPNEEREAAVWASANTPSSSEFLVITGNSWARDSVSEWFPVLANRRSLATVQGAEWLPGFSHKIEQYQSLQKCAFTNPECLDQWATSANQTFTYVYITKNPRTLLGTPRSPEVDAPLLLLEQLKESEHYQLEYDGPGAAIFRRLN